MMAVLYVAFGGFFGSMLRYGLSMKVNKHPVGTWIANITGALLLGIMLKLYQSDAISWSVWLFAGVGFSGAYTTFSTFSNEVLAYIVQEKFKQASIYAGSTFLIGILIVFIVLAI